MLFRSVRRRTKDADYTSSSSIVHTGFDAQDVEVAAKECGFDFDGVKAPMDENGNYAIAYSQFVVPLVKGMQEQQATIVKQQQLIEDLIQRIEKLENK